MKKTMLAVLTALVALVATTGTALAATPTTTTGAAGAVTSNSARLNGSVDPNGQATTYYFEYGTTSDYGERTGDAGAGSGTAPVSAEGLASGLSPQTTYHYRLVAQNATETTRGPDRTFATGTSPIALPPALPNVTTPEPTPVLGQTVVAAVAQGVVKVKLKGTSTFVPLTGKVSVPTGSELDTTKGAVAVFFITTKQGRAASAIASGGRFLLLQPNVDFDRLVRR